MLIQDTVIICGNADFWSMAVGADANLIVYTKLLTPSAPQLALVPRFVAGLVGRFFHDELLAVERNSTLLRFD